MRTRTDGGAALRRILHWRHPAQALPRVASAHHGSQAQAKRLPVGAWADRPDAGADVSCGEAVPAALLERARGIVRREMGSPEFGPNGLARALGMSRSKLYRLFGPAGGVAHFINRERLAEAHRRLSAGDCPPSINAIGCGVGFPDHSSFSRAFRRVYGHSPTEIRDGRADGRQVAGSALGPPAQEDGREALLLGLLGFAS